MDNPEKLMEKCGFIRCQIEISEFILTREKELFEAIKEKRLALDTEQSLLTRQKLMLDLAQLTGESLSLKTIWKHIAPMSACGA